MRKILITSIAIMSLVVVSCEKDLNQLPLSTTTAENFYASATDFEQARNAVYSTTFHGVNGDNYGYPNRILNLSETRSDNIYATTQAFRGWEALNNFFTVLDQNFAVEEAYIVNYNAIYKANQLIEKLDEKASEFFTDENEIAVMDAEAHFCRAFCYFDLVRYFGKVPLVDRVLTVQEAAELPQASVADVYNLIISDLQLAIQNLPATEAHTGEANKYWAHALLGLVYMTRSSSSYGYNGDLPGLGTNDWQLAYNHLDSVRASGEYSFAPTYSEIFTTEGAANVENVIYIPYENINLGVGGSWISTITSDQYAQYIGLSPDQGGIEERIVSPSFRSTFDDTDLRLQFGIIDTFTVTNAGRYLNYFSPDPIMIKFADDSRYGTGRTDWGVDFPVIRYTDVLMMMAECQLRGAAGTLDVASVINDVRERAGLARDAAPTLDALFSERRKEFFNEGKRWFDLYRSGNAVDVMQAWATSADDIDNVVNDDIKTGYLIYPIPRRELNTAPDLYTQNRDY